MSYRLLWTASVYARPRSNWEIREFAILLFVDSTTRAFRPISQRSGGGRTPENRRGGRWRMPVKMFGHKFLGSGKIFRTGTDEICSDRTNNV